MSDIKPMDDDTLHYVACEITHDLRDNFEQGCERVRWNNKGMAMLLARCNGEIQRVKDEAKAAYLEGYQAGLYTTQPNREKAWAESDSKARLEGTDASTNG